MNGAGPRKRQFASDNWAGICPEAMEALVRANEGHVHAYGDDEYTRRACDLIREFFETDCEVFFTFNGTAANSLALASLCQSYHSIICHELAHIETDECGAPEFFSNGTKVLLVPGEDGKVGLDAVERIITKRTDIHFPKPRVLSITQATEVGTVYRENEVRAAHDLAQRFGLRLHMDGARFSNAIASLAVPPRAITWEAGVDVLCFGGTKNGMPLGEAVVFFNKELSREFEYRCKQSGQLASKMRFLSAPWIGMLESGALVRYGAHANEMAEALRRELADVPGVTIKYPREANSVFVSLDRGIADALRAKGWSFYEFIGDGGARFMCSWDTTIEDTRALAANVRAAAALD